MEGAALDWITGTVLTALEREEPVGGAALSFLLRRYRETGRADLRDALEPALAAGLDRHAAAETIAARAAWLTLFAEAVTLSPDDRLLEATAALLASLRRDWGRTTGVEDAALSVDAPLRACGVVNLPWVAPEAVDELERIVAAAYRPGEGLAHSLQARDAARGRLADHLALSSALLTAHEISGRLPYSMLAEELVQRARRTQWDAAAGCFEEAALDRREAFLLNCEAARVLCRLAALHHDPGYLAAAVIRADAAYADDAMRILRSQETASLELGAVGAAYGLALSEWLALTERFASG